MLTYKGKNNHFQMKVVIFVCVSKSYYSSNHSRDARHVRPICHQTGKSGIAKRSGIFGISVSWFLKEIAQYNFQLN